MEGKIATNAVLDKVHAFEDKIEAFIKVFEDKTEALTKDFEDKTEALTKDFEDKTEALTKAFAPFEEHFFFMQGRNYQCGNASPWVFFKYEIFKSRLSETSGEEHPGVFTFF